MPIKILFDTFFVSSKSLLDLFFRTNNKTILDLQVKITFLLLQDYRVVEVPTCFYFKIYYRNHGIIFKNDIEFMIWMVALLIFELNYIYYIFTIYTLN